MSRMKHNSSSGVQREINWNCAIHNVPEWVNNKNSYAWRWEPKKTKLFKPRKEANYYKRDKLGCLAWEFKDVCSLRIYLNFQFEARGSRVEDFKTIFWTKGATIFITSQVLKMLECLSVERWSRMRVRKCQFAFTNITGKCYSLHMKTYKRIPIVNPQGGYLAPNQLLTLTGWTPT